jgi:hypothetical protein
MSSRECLRARETWSESFDLGTNAGTAVTAHLAGCRECAAFARAAEGARAGLGATALPPSDPAADLRLLEMLQGPAETSRVSPFAAWLAGWRSPAAPRLALAGLASFEATVGVAYGLTLTSAAGGSGDPAAGRAAAPAPRGFLANRIDLWLGSEPSAPAIREAPRVAPPRDLRGPKREERQPGGGRAGEILPALPVG